MPYLPPDQARSLCKHHHFICSTSFPPFFLLPTSSFLGARNTAQWRVPEKPPSSEEKEQLGVEATGHQLVVMYLQPQRWSLDLGGASFRLYPTNQSDWFKMWTHDYAESIRILLWNVLKWKGGNIVSGPAFPSSSFMNLLTCKFYCLFKCKVFEAWCLSCTIEKPPSNTGTLAEWERNILSFTYSIRMFIEGTVHTRAETCW